MNIFKLILAIILCQAAGLLGSWFTTPALGSWYAALQKPAFTPPGWVFGPVWITLYLLMAISAWLIWRQGLSQPGVKLALLFFLLQLAINAAWSPVFFGARSPAGALFLLALLLVLLFITIYLFFPLSRAAALLLLPYFLWSSFALVLNGAIVNLNR